MPETDEITPVIPKYPIGLKARGKRLWRELHENADFSGCPETRIAVEEACYLVDEIARQRRLVRQAGDNTRVLGSQGQPVSMPEIKDLQGNQNILLAHLKSLRLPGENGGDGKMSRSQAGVAGASARWSKN